MPEVLKTKEFHGNNVQMRIFIKVVRDPETEKGGTVVSDQIHRTRYIIVNILPECSFPYDWNYGLIHAMSIFALSGWEMSRAALEASKKWMQVIMKKEPKTMILNNARIQWLSLYVGKKEWSGTTKLLQHKEQTTDDDGAIDLDTHFINVREMAEATNDPLLKLLLEVADAEFPEISSDQPSSQA